MTKYIIAEPEWTGVSRDDPATSEAAFFECVVSDATRDHEREMAVCQRMVAAYMHNAVVTYRSWREMVTQYLPND